MNRKPVIRLLLLTSILASCLIIICFLHACQSRKAEERVVTLPVNSVPAPPSISNVKTNTMLTAVYQKYHDRAVAMGLPSNGLLLVLSVAEQTMALTQNGREVKKYTISTSAYGTGSTRGSNKTPLGMHKVNERIGEGEPEGRRFISRKPVNQIVNADQRRQAKSEDMVLTRILWLSGLEDGINRGGNVDSHSRCIYIHGTDQEQLLGNPSSHGCIRMSNSDVIDLFSLTKGRETWCWIME